MKEKILVESDDRVSGRGNNPLRRLSGGETREGEKAGIGKKNPPNTEEAAGKTRRKSKMKGKTGFPGRNSRKKDQAKGIKGKLHCIGF